MQEIDAHRRGSLIVWLADGAVLLLVVLGATVFGGPAEGGPAGQPQSYTCVEVGPPNPADDQACARRAADRARRTQLTAAQRAGLQGVDSLALGAVVRPGICNSSPQPVPGCNGLRLDNRSGMAAPGPDEVALLRRSFDQVGLRGGTVRIAGDRDLGPRGSIVFGVPVADGACYVGYLMTLAGTGSYGLTGRLPGGACL